MDKIDHGPAVHDRCRGHKKPEFDYPKRFEDRVPKKVRMLRAAKTDVLFNLANGNEMSAGSGEEYFAWTNKHGAVSAILPDGKKLGLYPSEFEVIEWLEPL
jgi:hypothetical protein